MSMSIACRIGKKYTTFRPLLFDESMSRYPERDKMQSAAFFDGTSFAPQWCYLIAGRDRIGGSGAVEDVSREILHRAFLQTGETGKISDNTTT
ncbi:hypothetical protein HYALB_00010338 [Hymenoscyphus albidus]|uniref:Uncharacterized protein n=1 Tax=Hymenoscyphus albidus TaxID=595503 RepID=A0A9N9LR59_9HELO|nr:hypothetical protein HYALB_00010338 [Hymenoscyphus albidus]